MAEYILKSIILDIFHLYLSHSIHLIFFPPGNYFPKEKEYIFLNYEMGAPI